jgi:OOP family OmpA-OmpF porin
MNNTSSLQEMRTIILGLNAEELSKLQQWLKDSTKFTNDIALILPEAMQERIAKDKSLERTLTPLVESAIYNSVKTNPGALADALYPVMAPAIRKSISEAIRGMLDTINKTIEKTFSTDLLLLRVKAAISGKSYAELLLAKSDFFQVKHVFLIDRKTGLLIQKVSLNGDEMEDADMITAMLTAIQDFVKDAFSKDIKRGDILDTIKIQDLNVWIQDGASSVLVLVMNGYIPESYRLIFKEKLEDITIHFGDRLSKFSGNPDDFQDIKPYLESCLIQNDKKEKKSKWKPLLLLSLLIIWIATILFFKIERRIHFTNFVTELNRLEGVMVSDSWKEGKTYHIFGMKDFSLHSFGKIAKQNHLDSNRIQYHWENFLSTGQKFMLQRFNNTFAYNKKIKAKIDAGQFFIEGEVSKDEYSALTNYISTHPELGRVNIEKLMMKKTFDVLKLKTEIDTTTLTFAINTTTLTTEQKQQVESICNKMQKILTDSPNARLEIISFTLFKERNDINWQIAERRNNAVVDLMKKKLPIDKSVSQKILNDTNRLREISFKVILPNMSTDD